MSGHHHHATVPELPGELMAQISMQVTGAGDLLLLSRLNKSWRAASNSQSAWQRLCLLHFPNVTKVMAGLNISINNVIDWMQIYRDHSALEQPPTPSASKPPATLSDFLFTYELSSSGCDATVTWTGTLQPFEGPGGPYCRMWSADVQPAIAVCLLSLQQAASPALSTGLHFRILVSRATDSGLRTIKLYEGSHIEPTNMDDWIAFETKSAPISEQAHQQQAAWKACEVGLQAGFAAPIDAPQLSVHPWLKLEDGFVDELFAHADYDGVPVSDTLGAKALVAYLEHLAPW